MVILNALYFNGYWRRPFPLNETFEAPFFVTPTTQLKTTFMRQTASFFYLDSKQLDAKILRLPYKGNKFAMTIVLPNSKGGLDELLYQMDSNTLHLAQYLMDEMEVRVELPKFKFDHTAHLNDVLMRVSMSIAEMQPRVLMNRCILAWNYGNLHEWSVSTAVGSRYWFF